MTMKEVRLCVMEWLSDYFSAYGFRCVKSRIEVEKKFPGGRQWIDIVAYDYRPLYKYGLTFNTRVERVEEIISKFSSVNPEYDKKSDDPISSYGLDEELLWIQRGH